MADRAFSSSIKIAHSEATFQRIPYLQRTGANCPSNIYDVNRCNFIKVEIYFQPNSLPLSLRIEKGLLIIILKKENAEVLILN